MEIPSSLYAKCTFCNEESICRVIKSRMSGKYKIKAVLKCSKCEKGFDMEMEIPKLISIRTIISQLEESTRTRVELPTGHELRVGDEIMVGDTCIQVMSIEVGNKRLNKAIVDDIDTIWTRYFNEIVVKVSINLGRTTQAEAFMTDPDDEFRVYGDIEIGKYKLYIYRIKTTSHMLFRPGAMALARDVVRLYCKHGRPNKKDLEDASIPVVDQGHGGDAHHRKRR